jgi:peptide/nickel transport system substrate-binding protein
MNLKRTKILMGCLASCLFLTLLIASCSAPRTDASPAAEPTGISHPIASPPPAHAPEIRFALIGDSDVSRVNVWQLFDRSGAIYANHAIYSGTLPSLYQLAPQDSLFQPFAAEGLPSEVMQDGDKYSAIVKLRPNLNWTDGSPFTAEDVAFTADTVLAFEFGDEWNAYYPRAVLDHAEVVDPFTVKFIFKKKPNVGDWQYGVLQAPVIQKSFWESAVQDASAFLPDDTLHAEIAKTRTSLEVAQPLLADLTAQVTSLRVNGKQNRKTESDYTRMQGEVVYLQATLDNLLEDYAAQVKSAQESLHTVDDAKAPTLGVWLSVAQVDGVWQKQANPDFPFGTPNFDRASYYFFENEKSAVTAFQNDEVDFILSPVNDLPAQANYNPSFNARFLVFNPLNVYIADTAFRSALDCMIDRNVLAVDVLQNKAAPLDSFVLSSQWHDVNLKDACAGMDQPARVAYAVQLLKDAGYSWAQEPAAKNAGQKIYMSNGEVFPKVTLLAPSKEEDALRYAAAKYIAEQAQYLGVPFAVQETGLNDIVYTVFSSQKYDMVLMGWRLSEYPAYLCEWFGGENPFLYESNRLEVVCEALKAESNLEVARQAVAQIESALLSELPFIPLFTVMQADVYRNLSYPVPAANILSGWAGFYGAPSKAIPVP